MRKMIEKKGITLIALVITIIVLLILAGVTINLTIGQDGIINTSEQAGVNYINAADYEKTQLAELSNEIDKTIDGTRENESDYSTNEQVIGTWVDGKTLYQRTWSNIPIQSPKDARTWYELFSIADLSADTIMVDPSASFIKTVNGDLQYSQPIEGYDGNVYFCTSIDMNENTMKLCAIHLVSTREYYVTVTLRYTKN